jgi:Kef-type K+ transport system membrane component KefB/predicted transcriptional regulator
MADVHFGILLILGIGAFGGVLGAWAFQKLHIPQVMGYIVLGLVLGQTGLHVIHPADIESLRAFNLFALGLIGFLVGGELQLDTFRRYGRQFIAILLGEGLMTFVLVGGATGWILYLVTHNIAAAAAGGVVLGAIASATDPASTIDVLWEYRAGGVLTTAIIAIIALDDALAMLLYGIGTGVASILTGGGGDVMGEALTVAIELLGAILMGGALGWLLNTILRRVHETQKSLAISVGTILLAIGIAVRLNMDVILATMTLGLTLVNLAPRRSRDLFALVRTASVPVYVLFFVLVGARLSLASMPTWLWGVVGAYVLCRTVAKMAGAWFGARITGAEDAVRKYTGLGLFAQGGVAVGLSIMASQHLGGMRIGLGSLSLGDLVIATVTATTLIVQVVGPPMVKLAVRLAGEIGRNVTEEDVVSAFRVRDVMDHEALPIHETDRIEDLLRLFAGSDRQAYPVVDNGMQVRGILTFENLREVLPNRDCWDWLVASDLMQSAAECVVASSGLHDAQRLMHDLQVQEIPVIRSASDRAPVGLLDARTIRRRVHEELIRRQRTGTPAASA